MDISLVILFYIVCVRLSTRALSLVCAHSWIHTYSMYAHQASTLFQLSVSIGHRQFPSGKDPLSTQTMRCSFCSLSERGEASPFRRSAPSCWHCSLVACSSGQSLIITGSAWKRVGFVRKQLSVLRARRQRERADKVEPTLRSIRSGTQGPVGCSIMVCFVCVCICNSGQCVRLCVFIHVGVMLILCKYKNCSSFTSFKALLMELLLTGVSILCCKICYLISIFKFVYIKI